MVKITYSPIEELIIHDVIEVEKEDLLRERVTPAGTMPLYWCDGYLFSFSSLPFSEEVIKDYILGKVHWLEVHFTKMKEYTSVLALNEDEYKATMNVRVIDTSKSDLHKKVVKWLGTVPRKL